MITLARSVIRRIGPASFWFMVGRAIALALLLHYFVEQVRHATAPPPAEDPGRNAQALFDYVLALDRLLIAWSWFWPTFFALAVTVAVGLGAVCAALTRRSGGSVAAAILRRTAIFLVFVAAYALAGPYPKFGLITIPYIVMAIALAAACDYFSGIEWLEPSRVQTVVVRDLTFDERRQALVERVSAPGLQGWVAQRQLVKFDTRTHEAKANLLSDEARNDLRDQVGSGGIAAARARAALYEDHVRRQFLGLPSTWRSWGVA